MRLLRLALATTTVGGLALTAGLAGVPAARATGLSAGTLGLSASTFSAGDCTGQTSPSGVSAPLADGVTVTRSLNIATTSTSAADPTDTVTLTGTEKATVTSTVSGGQLTSLTLTSAISGAATAAKGAASNCTTSSSGTGWNLTSGVNTMIHRSTAGWLHFSLHTSGVGGQSAIAQLSASGVALINTQLGAFAVRDISDDQWVYVPAGDYHLQAQIVGATATFPKFPKASLQGGITMTFLPAGVAKTSEAGTAKPMVTFPSRLTCTTGKAAVALTSKIKGAASVALQVNGATKRTIKHPGAARVSLGVPTNEGVTLKAVVHKNGKTLSATRSYRAC